MKSYTFILKSPSEKSSLLYLAIREKGKRVLIPLNIKENPQTFDKSNFVFTKENPHYRLLNARMAQVKAVVEKEIREAEVMSYDLDTLRESIAQKINVPITAHKHKDDFLSYFDKWATMETSKRKFNRQTLTTSRMLREFFGARNPTFDDINYTFSEEFIEMMRKRGLSPNTRGTHIKYIKTAMNAAFLEKRHNNSDFMRFRKELVPVDNIYLTSEEVDAIARLELVGCMEVVRDAFLIGCHTGMRFSDFSRVQRSDIHDGVIHNINAKTGVVVEIPAHPRVIRIIDKHGGKAPKVHLNIMNRYIKEICRMAGIDSIISLRKYGRTITCYKWEVVTSHTARRTGITNMYKAGVPVYRCMMISGHTTEKVFLSYLKISQEENAQALLDNPFFNE